MSKVFITGDTHGSDDLRRFSSKQFVEGRDLNKNDVVIIAGDYGGLWFHWDTQQAKDQRYWIDWLNDKPWTTLFIDGNHENFNMLKELPVEHWDGNPVGVVADSILHLRRGYVYNINGFRIFTFGGAMSIDKMHRINQISWWPEEIPNKEETERGINNLDKNNWTVDCVVTHAAPKIAIESLQISYRNFNINKYEDPTVKILDYFYNGLKFDKWFFGHYHFDFDNEYIKMHCLYNRIIEIWR